MAPADSDNTLTLSPSLDCPEDAEDVTWLSPVELSLLSSSSIPFVLIISRTDLSSSLTVGRGQKLLPGESILDNPVVRVVSVGVQLDRSAVLEMLRSPVGPASSGDGTESTSDAALSEGGG